MCRTGKVRLAGAKKLLENALEIDLAAGMKKPPADKLICLGDVLRHQGELARATKTYQDALAQSRDGGDKSNTAYAFAYALMGLGEIALDSADFANARSDYTEALTIRSELGEKKNVAATQVAMAQLAIDDGRPGDAPAPLKSAIERFRELRTRDDELGATLLLIQTLLAEHKASDANRELSGATRLASNSQSPALKVRFEMAVAAVEAASGTHDSAVSHLRKALATALKLGFVKCDLECRLNMELVNAKFNTSAETGFRLNALAKDATDKGFILIARRASENAERLEMH